VILEDMSAGLPIVTTRWRGPANFLVEGENAVFVPPRDSVALASSLTRLLKEDQLRCSMGQANREKGGCSTLTPPQRSTWPYSSGSLEPAAWRIDPGDANAGWSHPGVAFTVSA
jgi:Glycosyl transferases group 1